MLFPVLVAAIALLAVHLYRKVQYKRFQQFSHLPQLPPNIILGHLKALGELMSQGPEHGHTDYSFAKMRKQLNDPSIMFVDFRPLNYALTLVSSHHVAEQISRSSKLLPASAPKPLLEALLHLVGQTSILVANGDAWKALRKKYSPAFAPQHIMSSLPHMLSKTGVFVEHLERLARTGEEFAFLDLAMNLAFDIIGAVVMGADLEAQHVDPARRGEIVTLYGELYETYWDDRNDVPWWLAPRVEMRRRRLSERVDVLLKDIIRAYHARQAGGDAAAEQSSILSLSLPPSEEPLTQALVDETCDQIKTFLLAGHDTTSITLSWVMYWLSRVPHALAAVRAELDTLLGPDPAPSAIRARLLQLDGPDLIRRMTYTSAVIKESLRLNPPSATVRYTPPGTGLTVQTPEGGEYCLDGTMIYNCQRLIHRDRSVYGDSADEFVPERWLGEGEGPGGVPAGAFRGFERGPRNCIGQDFALIELRVVVAMVVRRFAFVKTGLGEVVVGEGGDVEVDGRGVGVVKEELYISRQMNARPVDGMKMKVRVR